MAAVAEALGYEVRTLRRKLDAEATSFSKLSDEVRLAMARELLDLTNLSIGDIAAATGFASTSVFSEAFRRWTGTTAMRMRMNKADANFAD
jgi:transcriptional regulator GlxA family with amidase domain